MDCVKICITGPESSGKTTLAKTLAKNYHAVLVEEVAREYLEKFGGKYNFEDLEKIARLQQEAINSEKEKSLIFCDTDLLTIKIWAEDKFQKPIDWVNETLEKNPPSMYLLCYPDLPWEADPLREDESRLEIIFQKYLTELENRCIPFFIVKGKGDKRTTDVISILNLMKMKGEL